MMILRLDELPNDICSESEEVFKYFKDLKVMMEGILDLNRRGSLPELEKATTITLLLRITLKYDVFGEKNISESKVWLSTLEGSRKRAGRASFQGSYFNDKDKIKEDLDDQIRGNSQSINPLNSRKNRSSNGIDSIDVMSAGGVRKKKKRKNDALNYMKKSLRDDAMYKPTEDENPGKMIKTDAEITLSNSSSASVLLQQQILRGPVNKLNNLYMEDDDDDDHCYPYNTN